MAMPNSPKSHRLSSKTPWTSWENSFLNCWSEKSKRLPKQYTLFMLPLIASQRLNISLCCWTMHVGHRIQGIGVVYNLRTSSWGLSLIVPEDNMRAFKRGKKKNNSPIPTFVTSMIHNNNQNCKMSQGRNSGTHTLVVTSSRLVGFWGLPKMKGIMPDTIVIQLPSAGEVMDLREFSAITLLNQRKSWLHCSYFPYTHR